MYLKTITLFVIGAATVAGWRLPEGQPNGVYTVQKRADGTNAHKLIRSLEEESPSDSKEERSEKVARQSSVYCGGYALNATDTNTTVQAVMSDCDNNGPVPAQTTLYSISNDVVTYFCNWSDDTDCTSTQISDAINNITSSCGSDNAGWDIWPLYAIGSESVTADTDFCGTGAT